MIVFIIITRIMIDFNFFDGLEVFVENFLRFVRVNLLENLLEEYLQFSSSLCLFLREIIGGGDN